MNEQLDDIEMMDVAQAIKDSLETREWKDA